jgi:CheY-like chemotaxis protein
MKIEKKIPVLNILIAEDDADDRFFFDRALSELDNATRLTAVNDGEQLMDYLTEHPEDLPDVLFLDINMPRKSGYECMSEIKGNPLLKDLFVVMFSTFYSRQINYEQEMLIKLHNIGMEDFIRKPQDFEQLKQTILKVLDRATAKKLVKEQQTKS